MIAIQIWIMNRVKQVKKMKYMIRSTNMDTSITAMAKTKVTTQKKLKRKMKAVVVVAANLSRQYCESSNRWRIFWNSTSTTALRAKHCKVWFAKRRSSRSVKSGSCVVIKKTTWKISRNSFARRTQPTTSSISRSICRWMSKPRYWASCNAWTSWRLQTNHTAWHFCSQIFRKNLRRLHWKRSQTCVVWSLERVSIIKSRTGSTPLCRFHLAEFRICRLRFLMELRNATNSWKMQSRNWMAQYMA